MTERISSSAFPYVPLTVRIFSGSREIELRIDAMIDTGFDGDLMIPGRLRAELGEPKLDAIWYLADGTPVEVPSYDAQVQLSGLNARHEVTVSCLGPTTLIGMSLLKSYRVILDHGLPCNLYGDRLGVFVRNDDHWTLEEELAGQQSPTQFGQMLAELAIGYIAAHSPQAKGRIERLWETLQDRLVQELRLRGITTVPAAEIYLPEFMADFNRRLARPPRETVAAWRRAPRDLDRILACRYARVVARDNTVSLPGRWIQIPPGPGQRSRHSCRVEVREPGSIERSIGKARRIVDERPKT